MNLDLDMSLRSQWNMPLSEGKCSTQSKNYGTAAKKRRRRVGVIKEYLKP